MASWESVVTACNNGVIPANLLLELDSKNCGTNPKSKNITKPKRVKATCQDNCQDKDKDTVYTNVLIVWSSIINHESWGLQMM
jgi:hypothetical protein